MINAKLQAELMAIRTDIQGNKPDVTTAEAVARVRAIRDGSELQPMSAEIRIDHMPADKGDVRAEGTVPGNPVEDAIQKDQLHPAAQGFNDPLTLPDDKATAKK